MRFRLVAPYEPQGDQINAISQLVSGVKQGSLKQVLLGVTGSGKTFTTANVIQELNKPALILSHNKTLAAQLYGELKQFFPDNAVEYYVSYYDYYQPEAYIPHSDLYIAKDLAINQDLEKLRLRSVAALLSERTDVIIVASVSCIYGVGNPLEFSKNILRISVGDKISQQSLLLKFVDMLYSRNDAEFKRTSFRVRGDTVDIFLAYADYAVRFLFWGDEIESIYTIDPFVGTKINEQRNIVIFPANLFVTSREVINKAICEIQRDMMIQVGFFESQGRTTDAKRIQERTELDIEMLREIGYCSGVENYSRYFDNRKPGERPYCLLDYFPDDYLMVIDESHVTIPQIGGMYGGDRSRKMNLVEYGFRLPSALDNRPLNFHEFETIVRQAIYVSATPGDYEMEKTGGSFVEQVVRPTGLLDPPIEVRPSLNQIDDLMEQIDEVVKRHERVLVTTLTKRMAEELNKYLGRVNIRCRYIHSEVDTLDRIEIIRDLRLGKFDVLIGVNLLREGLDLPEVSLVAILDADKEGFLRNRRSLIQVSGRAARNINGKVIMYADRITNSMELTIDETNRRREKQIKYNTEHGITPQTILKSRDEIMKQASVLDIRGISPDVYIEQEEELSLVAEPVMQYMTAEQLSSSIESTRKKMLEASRDTDFLTAAKLRDEMVAMQKMLKEKFGSK